MSLFIGISLFLIIIGLILMGYIAIYNKYQAYIIRINEAEASIDSVLRKRFDLLNKSIGIIKANIAIDGDILEGIVKLRSRKLSNFDLDRQLYESINEFHEYLQKYPDLEKVESFMRIEISLSETEAEIVAFRKYYNDIITEYNKLIRTFPTNIVGIISKYKYRPYFDGKDMTDEVTNDFKL